jgi:hypothetical protein
VAGRNYGLDNRDWIGVAALAVGVSVLAILMPGDWLGAAGLLATIVGLAIAIGQIRLAREQIEQAVKVSEATKAAVTRTRAVVARNLLIEQVGLMQSIDRAIFESISQKQSAEAVASHLAAWRDAAYGIIGLIDGTAASREDLRESLVSTAKAAADLRDRLPEEVSELATKTRKLRSEISGTCGLLEVAKTKMRLDTEQGDHLDG